MEQWKIINGTMEQVKENIQEQEGELKRRGSLRKIKK